MTFGIDAEHCANRESTPDSQYLSAQNPRLVEIPVASDPMAAINRPRRLVLGVRVGVRWQNRIIIIIIMHDSHVSLIINYDYILSIFIALRKVRLFLLHASCRSL